MNYQETNPYLQALNAAYSALGSKNGFSGRINTLESPTIGYMVAIKDIKAYNSLSEVNVAEMWPIYERYCKENDTKNLYLGSFKDPIIGKVYFEISINLSDINFALGVADEYNQKYIYDVISDTNIPV